MKVTLALLIIALTAICIAQRPPKYPELASQWSAFMHIDCGPITCGSGRGYYQYDYVGQRVFMQMFSPSSQQLTYTLANYKTNSLYIYNSNGCEQRSLKEPIPSPTFLGDAFFQGQSGDLFTYTTLNAWPDFWFDKQERHQWTVKVVNSTSMYSIPSEYMYTGPISIESRDYITMSFNSYLAGPESLNNAYWRVPSVCE